MSNKTRFWAGGSSSESESENESDSEEEVQNQKQSGGKFGMIYESDSGKYLFKYLFIILYLFI